MVNPGSRYATFVDGELRIQSLRETVGQQHPKIWSARLSSGLFGVTSCTAGNRGPKGLSEVLLAPDFGGLDWLIRSGFLPCPVCKPLDSGCFDDVETAVHSVYGSWNAFLDRERHPFDARKVCWEEILPITGAAPGRLYVPQDLSSNDVQAMHHRFSRMGVSTPPIGCYDRDAPGRFREYVLPHDPNGSSLDTSPQLI